MLLFNAAINRMASDILEIGSLLNVRQSINHSGIPASLRDFHRVFYQLGGRLPTGMTGRSWTDISCAAINENYSGMGSMGRHWHAFLLSRCFKTR